MKRYFTLLLLLACTFVSCRKSKSDPVNQAKIDEADIQAYSNNYGLEAVKDPASGIYYKITKAGLGVKPVASSEVTFTYDAELLDGTKIIASNTLTIKITNLIKGLQAGLILVDKQAKATLLIPSALAFGPAGNDKVPPNKVLVYHVELVNFTN
jgi:FKBP-type peptidyl-prolyl cis-trans isomerase FkpA